MSNEPYMVSANAKLHQIHPRLDIVLVRRLPDEEVTKSGLIIPEIARDKLRGYRIGEVLRVGLGDWLEETGALSGNRYPMECQVGDRVLYMRCPDNDVCIDGVDCVLLREEQHVLAILEMTANWYKVTYPTQVKTEVLSAYAYPA